MDMQCGPGNPLLRFSTPLHAESAKENLTSIKSTVADFYRVVIEVFPEMVCGARKRLFSRISIERRSKARPHGQTYEGVRLWIEENLRRQSIRQSDGLNTIM